MDEERFDAISMSVGRSASRRGAVRALLGGIVGLGGAALQGRSAEVEAGNQRQRCTSLRQQCGNGKRCCNGLGCAVNTCFGSQHRCCKAAGQSCRRGQHCDCCRPQDYCDTGRCQPRRSPACSNPGRCDTGFPNCGGTASCTCAQSWQSGPKCVVRNGGYCADDCSTGCRSGYVCTVNLCGCGQNHMACQPLCGVSGSTERGNDGEAPNQPLPVA